MPKFVAVTDPEKALAEQGDDPSMAKHRCVMCALHLVDLVTQGEKAGNEEEMRIMVRWAVHEVEKPPSLRFMHVFS